MKNTWMILVSICLSQQLASALQVNVQQTSGFSSTQIEKLNQSVVILNQVLNSPQFKEKVLAFKFVQTNGFTNQQIYESIMAGAEKFPVATVDNQLADIKISIYFPPWYKRFTKAVAFTSQSDPYLHIFNSYYNSSKIPDLSETIIHEWIHKLGFDHDFNATSRRPFSVPYGVGGIINELVLTYLK